ncbi:MAG: TlpA family protein disulfide reductase, partial [Rikenellaceae bacterium]|nr:TlpA family protein disulfide reductase [Rikenellaceae bacterium]
IQTGDYLPAFTLSGKDGYTFSPEVGTAYLITFFNPTCQDCRRELPKLETVWENLRGQEGFEMVNIVRDMTLDQLSEAAEGSRWLAMPVYPDPDREVYRLFATQTIPRIYLTDRSGTILRMWVNEVPETAEDFLALIQASIEKP